MLLFEAGNTI